MGIDRDKFFDVMRQSGLALTFDDVRLDTGRSHFAAGSVNITSKFSRNVELRVPMVSAAMDTVTTAKMAIAMAKIGGIGVIHAGLSPERQREEVRRVKLELNGRIDNPVTVKADETLGDVLAMCERRDFSFRTFPVIDDDDIFVGLLTQNDFDFGLASPSILVRDVMIPASKVTVTSKDVDVNKAYDLMKKLKEQTLPIVSKKGAVQGMYVLSDVLRLVHGNPEQYNLDAAGRLRVAAAVPTDEGALERIRLMGDYLDVAVIDTAQGDSDFALATLKQIKKEFPKLDVVIGNVSNADSARELAEAGADGIKVGQGPGSICTTRIETGIGCPQVTAVYECVQAVKDLGVPVCADGGINNPGDISIAIAAGASSVMMGSKLAGTKETPGEILTNDNGQLVKLYRGMGSPSAMEESEASRKRYGVEGAKGVPLSEGVESYIPYRGSVVEMMDHYVKALRKSMSYVGSGDIETHRTKTRFIRITNAGYRESRPHDVAVITR
ncbi:MAG TPA: IMP dehydrogenase [Candidatus Saccharimonadales bacterium]|nr:IMP dehydrogenase [Candidatus Saccharimonadales bacterium]